MDENIMRMTKLAETNQGCALRDQLAKIPFEESLNIMRLIAVESLVDHAVDSGIPIIIFSPDGLGGNLGIRRSIFRPDPMVSDQLRVSSDIVKRSITCNK